MDKNVLVDLLNELLKTNDMYFQEGNEGGLHYIEKAVIDPDGDIEFRGMEND